MTIIWQDTRLAARLLRKSPGFTLPALLAIALATGANTAVFSLVYSVVLRPLPFPDPSRLVSITQFHPLFNQSAATSPPHFQSQTCPPPATRLASLNMGPYP